MPENHETKPDINSKSGIRTIPPFIFITALAAAFIANYLWPMALLPNLLQYAVGIFLIVVSFLLIPSIFNKFRSAKTSLDVRKIPTNLLTDGAFAFSRNPIYLSMITLCLGIGVFFDNIWIIPSLVMAVIYLTVRVIQIEEAVLEEKFGETYLNYKKQVRRWL